MANEAWTDHAGKALQAVLNVIARFLVAVLPQLAVSLGLLLICTIMPSTLGLKLRLNVAYKSDFIESTRDVKEAARFADAESFGGLYDGGAFSNDFNNRYDTTTGRLRVLPFLPDSDETIHLYDGFRHSAAFAPGMLNEGQTYAKYALSLGGPVLATGSPLRFSNREPDLSIKDATAIGRASLGFASFLVPLVFYALLFAVFAGFRFFFRDRLAFFKLVVTMIVLWGIYSFTAGAVASYNAAEIANAVTVHFKLRLLPVLPSLLAPPICILVASLVYYGAASLFRQVPSSADDSEDPFDESGQKTNPITGDV